MRALMSGTGAPPGAHVAVCDPPATDDDTHHQAGSYSVTGRWSDAPHPTEHTQNQHSKAAAHPH